MNNIIIILVVQWLHENRSEGCSKRAIDWAAENGQLEVIQFLHLNRKEGFSSSLFSFIPNHIFNIMAILKDALQKRCL